MAAKKAATNSWEDFIKYATNKRLNQIVPRLAANKFVNDIKLMIHEFQITEIQLLNKNITEVAEIVTKLEDSKFKNRANNKKDNIDLIRKNAFSFYLDYLRVKMHWPTIKYEPMKKLIIYLEAPPAIIKPKALLNPYKNNLIEYERMMIEGTFGDPTSKGVVSSYSTYIHDAIKCYGLTKSKFNDRQITDIPAFISKFKLEGLEKYLSKGWKKKDWQNSKAALETYLKYLKFKSTIPVPFGVKKATVKRSSAKPLRSQSNKNYSTYKFNGRSYKKSRVIHAVISKYVSDHRPTLLKLQKAFPDNIIKNDALFRKESKAKEINNKDKQIRYYTKPNELIKLEDEMTIAITSQVTLNKINLFIPLAAKHKYIITS